MRRTFKFLTNLTITAALVLGMSFVVMGATPNNAGGQQQTTVSTESTQTTPVNKCGKNSVWSYDKATKTLTISGTGNIKEIAKWDSLDIRHIDIQEGITSIGRSAFSQLEKSKTVSLPKSLERIGRYAFYQSGITEINIEDNVTFVGYNAFSFCKKLKTVKWNSPIIPTECFYYSKNLETVILGNKVKKIEGFVFGHTAIKSIVIPNSVTSIEYSCFNDCKQLEKLKLSDNITVLPSNFIYGCKNLTSLDLPKSLKRIRNNAFSGCHLEKIILPNSVNKIGKYAFSYVRHTKEIKLPNSLKYIRDELFYECNSLEKITIGKKVKYIGESAFAYCKNLKSITIPGNVKVIGYGAFQYSGLESIEIKKGVKKIDFWAFNNCKKLKSVSIAETTTIIEENVFSHCKSLTTIKVDSDNPKYATIDNCLTNKSKTELYIIPAGKSGKFEIPSGIKDIEYYAFNGCSKISSIGASNNGNYTSKDGILYNSSMTKLIKCPIPKTGTITIPSTVTRIEESAFAYSKASKITIPDSVKSMGYSAFEYCANLKSIKIPESVKTVSNAAFWGCSKLRKVTIEQGVTRIARNAFHDCDNLRKVIIPPSVNKIGKSSFSDCWNVTFYCKKSSFAMSYAVNKWSIDYKLI